MRQSPDFRIASAIKGAIKAAVKRIKSQPLLPLCALFLLAFTVRAVFPDTSYFFWDEAVYLLHGKLFAGQEVGYSETFLRPPLLPLMLSPFAGLASYELVSRLLMAFLNSFVIFPAYYFTRFFFNKKAAVVANPAAAGLHSRLLPTCAAIIVAVLPVHILNSRWIMTDALGALLAFSSVTAYVLGLRQQKKLLIYVGGILAGLAVLMKFTNLLLLALLLPFLLANLRKRLPEIAVSIAAAAAVMAPYLITSALSFGSPFYTFSRAFHVVAEQGAAGAAGLGFIFYLLNDSLGFLAVFLALGVAFSVFPLIKRLSQSQWKLQKWNLRNLNYQPCILYCLFATLAYSFFIIGRGVSKPFGLEWEAERFMLLFILFAIPLISYGLVQSFALLKNSRRAVALFVAVAVTIATVFSLYPQFVRAYSPTIVHEDGLREVTKEMGLFIEDTAFAEFGCLGNCPPVSFYSGKKMSVYYAAPDLAAANHSTVVVFDSDKERLLSKYSVAKEFCSGSHCAYLLSRR